MARRRKSKSKNSMFGCLTVILGFIALVYLGFTKLLPLINKLNVEPFSQGDQMVFFHMNKCGHCKRMMPEWEKFQSQYQGNLKLDKVEASSGDNRLSKNKSNIPGYPTILILDGQGNKKTEYNGDRTAADLKKFAQKHS